MILKPYIYCSCRLSFVVFCVFLRCVSCKVYWMEELQARKGALSNSICFQSWSTHLEARVCHTLFMSSCVIFNLTPYPLDTSTGLLVVISHTLLYLESLFNFSNFFSILYFQPMGDLDPKVVWCGDVILYCMILS